MTPTRRLRVPTYLQEMIRGLHLDLKRKVRAALDVSRADALAGKDLRDDLARLRSFGLASQLENAKPCFEHLPTAAR